MLLVPHPRGLWKGVRREGGGAVVEGWANIINDARKEYYCVKVFLWIPYPVAKNARKFQGFTFAEDF